MYTISKAVEVLGVSKVTIYKHMTKNGINKGKNLTEEEIKVLQNSVKNSKGINGKRKPLTGEVKLLEEKLKNLTYSKSLIDEELIMYEKKNTQLEKRIRELEGMLSTKEVLLNEAQIKQAELLDNKQKLLEEKSNKKSWWKR